MNGSHSHPGACRRKIKSPSIWYTCWLWIIRYSIRYGGVVSKISIYLSERSRSHLQTHTIYKTWLSFISREIHNNRANKGTAKIIQIKSIQQILACHKKNPFQCSLFHSASFNIIKMSPGSVKNKIPMILTVTPCWLKPSAVLCSEIIFNNNRRLASFGSPIYLNYELRVKRLITHTK